MKLRKLLQKDRNPDNLLALQKLIEDDILGSIETNLLLGNISINDAYRLQQLTKQLYNYIYAHYAEMEELNDMTDESLILDIDIIEKKYEKLLAEKEVLLAEKLSAIAEKDSMLKEQNLEIARLKAELEKLLQR